MSNPEYQKIPGPFKRDPVSKKVVRGLWSTPELALLHGLDDWIFTEKVDGTNVRVFWDGHRVTYAGRTDRAEFSNGQRAALDKAFAGSANETLFEQQFGNQAATLYGELYGPGVQSGGAYRDDLEFILFDVRIGEWWLMRENVAEVADGIGVNLVPVVLTGSLDLAIDHVTLGLRSEVALDSKSDLWAEGLVGTIETGLLARNGQRIIVKVKHEDLYDG